MKVVFITGHFPPMRSGVGDYTHSLANALAEQSIQVDVLTSIQAGSKRQLSNGVGIYPIVKDWGWASVRLLRAALLTLRPDIIHIQYPSWYNPDRTVTVHLLPLLLRGLPNRPAIVFTLHEVMRARWRWLARPLISALFSDHIITVDEFDQQFIQKLFFFKEIKNIPIGSNIPYSPLSAKCREQIRTKLGVKTDEVLLFYFGAVRPTTGIDKVLQAYSSLSFRLPFLKFLLVSDLDVFSDKDYIDPMDARRVKDLLTSLEFANQVIVRGYTESTRLSKYITACDVGVFFYTDGAASQRGALLAGLTHGLPVLTTANDLLPKNYVHLENMFLIKQNDMSALLTSLEKLATSSDLRVRLKNGALKLAKNFDWEYIAKQTQKVYEGLIKR